jgi:hypothetical protein
MENDICVENNIAPLVSGEAMLPTVDPRHLDSAMAEVKKKSYIMRKCGKRVSSELIFFFWKFYVAIRSHFSSRN